MKSQTRNSASAFSSSALLGYEAAAAQRLKADSGWLGGSRGEGLAGAGWHAATARAACSLEQCSLLKALGPLFLKASVLPGG